MKKIAIFVSGAGEAAERIVKLFNEGNRVHTALVVVDDSAVSMVNRLNGEDVTVLHIPDEEWASRSGEITDLIKDNEIKLLALDNFSLSFPEEIVSAVEGEIIKLSSPEMAPREVVDALEADLRRPRVEEVKVEEKPEEEMSTPESEWADALKIRFTPPKVPQTPPVVPETPEERREENQFQQGFFRREEEIRRHDEEHRKEEPMPSTWLIWSILVTIFCCFIPGIIAIIFSSQVSSRYYIGDIEGARRASRNAEIWIIVSVVLGVIFATLYLPFTLIGW